MRSRARSDAGFALIEVVVSAAVLAIVALAVLAGVDGASSSTAREKARTVAASLAEQDQERLRSMQVDSLAGYSDPPRTVTVDDVNYTVASAAAWIRDDTGGTTSCINNAREADYLHITSTVTSNVVGSRIKPVVIDSLVAPSVAYSSTRGTLGVKVNDRNGAGVPGMTVSISGPDSDSGVTNADGCAMFEYIAVGDYTITLNRPAWVDRHGNNPASVNAVVTTGTVNVKSIDYDQAATVATTIKTYDPPGSTTAMASKAPYISTINSAEPMRTFTPILPPANSITASGLFPFTTAYPFWTGKCAYNNPETYNANYFATNVGDVQTNPGGTYATDVYHPPFNVRIAKNYAGSTIANGLIVKATVQKPTGSTDTCTDTIALTTIAHGGTNGWLSQTATAWDPGLPFGKYSLCAWDPVGLRKFSYPTGTTYYDNTAPNGQSSTLVLTAGSGNASSWTTGTCP